MNAKVLHVVDEEINETSILATFQTKDKKLTFCIAFDLQTQIPKKGIVYLVEGELTIILDGFLPTVKPKTRQNGQDK